MTTGSERPDRSRTAHDGAILKRLQLRAAVLDAVRAFFCKADFLEVCTPILLNAPGQETHIHPFVTSYHDQDNGTSTCYLVTSPEHHMKRLLGCGCQRIFQINSCFRNGESTAMHLPEFTMVEWYRTQAGYDEVAEDTENLVRSVSERVFGSMTESPGVPSLIGVTAKWQHLSISQAFETFAGIDPLGYPENDVACFRRDAFEKAGVIVTPADSWEEVFFKLMIERVEPGIASLPHPVFLRDYPASLAALARISPADSRVAERLELYIGGVELANGFSELTDGREQRRRFMSQRLQRRRLQAPVLPLDEAFLRMLSDGRMPMAGGMALGLDRLIAVLSGVDDIHETCAFSMDQDTI